VLFRSQLSSAGPLFTAGWSNWNRTPNSTELFGYPGLTGSEGVSAGLPTSDAFVYFTYLAPGDDFTKRWLVRRSLTMYVSPESGSTPPPALETLSVWSTKAGGGGNAPAVWVSTGPVTPSMGTFTLATPSLALLATSPLTGFVGLEECLMPLSPSHGLEGWQWNATVALTVVGECGTQGNAFSSGAVVRASGWVAPTSSAASSLGWTNVTVAGCTTGCQRLGAAPGVLWRCVSKDTPFPVYSATFNDPSCGSAGPNAGLALQFVPDAQLGFALSTVQAM